MVSVEAYTDYFCRKEPISTSKFIFRFLKVFKPELASDFVLVYTYLRKLDNLVDSGRNPEKMARVLSVEKSKIEKIIADEKPANRNSPLPYIKEKYGKKLLDCFIGCINGMEIDNSIILEGIPPKEEKLKERNLLGLISSMRLLSLFAFKQDLEYSEKFKELMHTWAAYDNLRDAKEDLAAGLMLFSKEELSRYNVALKRGMYVPSSFEEFFYSTKDKTIKELKTRAQYAAETNLPMASKPLLAGYFATRAIKLGKQNYPLEESMIIGRK